MIHNPLPGGLVLSLSVSTTHKSPAIYFHSRSISMNTQTVHTHSGPELTWNGQMLNSLHLTLKSENKSSFGPSTPWTHIGWRWVNPHTSTRGGWALDRSRIPLKIYAFNECWESGYKCGTILRFSVSAGNGHLTKCYFMYHSDVVCCVRLLGQIVAMHHHHHLLASYRVVCRFRVCKTGNGFGFRLDKLNRAASVCYPDLLNTNYKRHHYFVCWLHIHCSATTKL